MNLLDNVIIERLVKQRNRGSSFLGLTSSIEERRAATLKQLIEELKQLTPEGLTSLINLNFTSIERKRYKQAIQQLPALLVS